MEPGDVMQMVLKYAGLSGKDSKDATFILLVDSIQKLYQTDTVAFQDALASLIANVNDSVPFVTVVCSGTFYRPIAEFLRGTLPFVYFFLFFLFLFFIIFYYLFANNWTDSAQRRVFLTPPRLNGHQVLLF